jgi:hypothetical protein
VLRSNNRIDMATTTKLTEDKVEKSKSRKVEVEVRKINFRDV